MILDRVFWPKWRAAGAALAAVLLAVGCGGSGPFDLIPVDGKVTYEDGSLIQATRIEIQFDPDPESVKAIDGKHARMGMAEVNVADGTFSGVTSSTYEDGLSPGKHFVSIQIYEKEGAEPLELGTLKAEEGVVIGPDNCHLELKVKKP